MSIVAIPEFHDYVAPGRVFFETGLWHGDAVQRALDCGFEEIYSIELNSEFYEKGKERFADYPQVNLYYGDSANELTNIICKIDKQIVFWLDAHYSSEGFGRGVVDVPVYHELTQIWLHTRNDHIILIDDMIRLFRKEKHLLEQQVMLINRNYKITYVENGEVLVARID